MYTLRRITSESIEINTCVGLEYTLILKERNEVEFQKTSKLMKWDEAKMISEIYGFISHSNNNGCGIIPLYKKSNYFVMMSDGKTFSNITYK